MFAAICTPLHLLGHSEMVQSPIVALRGAVRACAGHRALQRRYLAVICGNNEHMRRQLTTRDDYHTLMRFGTDMQEYL